LSKQYSDLDQISHIAQPDHLQSPFQPPSIPVPQAPSKGPKRVYFIFSAAKPAEVAQAGKKIVEPYGGSGGEEWRPYFPSSRKIGSIAKQTAANDELNLWSDQLEISTALPDKIRDAEKRRELVVMFVDSWTTKLANYLSTLQAFDRQNYFNTSVIVPWNDQDPETKKNDLTLMNALKTALQFRCSNQNDLYYRALVKTEEDLRAQLSDILTRLRAEVINKSVPAEGAVPPGAAKPVITGPGS
jgi:FxsC-like protein